MANLPDLRIGALTGEPEEQIRSLVQQLNEWGRRISNEDITRIIKSESGVEALTIGQLPNGAHGILIRNNDGIPTALFGQFPDGTIAIVIAKDGENVFDVLT